MEPGSWWGDAGDVSQGQAAVAETVARFGRIDCLVNCAGLTTRGTMLDTTPELFDEHIAVNLRGSPLAPGVRTGRVVDAVR